MKVWWGSVFASVSELCDCVLCHNYSFIQPLCTFLLVFRRVFLYICLFTLFQNIPHIAGTSKLALLCLCFHPYSIFLSSIFFSVSLCNENFQCITFLRSLFHFIIAWIVFSFLAAASYINNFSWIIYQFIYLEILLLLNTELTNIIAYASNLMHLL